MTSLERASRAIEEHLSSVGFDRESINRIVLEDLPFLTIWELEPHSPREISAAAAVVAFAFGFGPARQGVPHPPGQYHPLLYEPGRTNEALADFIVPFARRNVPVFAQWEVADALNGRGVIVPETRVARPDKTYLGTSGVVEQFVDSGLHEFRSIVLVAHRHHAFRCREITSTIFRKRAISTAILVPDRLPDVYDVDSVQPWTRSLTAWVSYEVATRFHSRLQGNM
jgi:hypothetical protein